MLSFFKLIGMDDNVEVGNGGMMIPLIHTSMGEGTTKDLFGTESRVELMMMEKNVTKAV